MAGKSLVHISVISVARTWPWMACDYSEICLLLAERMVSAMLLTALFRLFRKVNTFYRHAGKLWSLLRTNQSTALAEEWILLGLSLFLLTRLPWVLCCKNTMVMGPHGLQLCFPYLPSSTVKIFCGCSEDQFLADYMLEIPTQYLVVRYVSFPMPEAGKISFTIPNFKCGKTI